MTLFKRRVSITDIVPPYTFESALTLYNIYPWIQEDTTTLVRILRLSSGSVIKAEIRARPAHSPALIEITIKSLGPIGAVAIQEIKQCISWCLRLDINPRPFYKLCRKDPILRAAKGSYRGDRGKIYPTVFEAIIGVICAQNTVFKRLYSMMYNISTAFGMPLEMDGQTYYAFPTVDALAAATDADLRACKVGYRAKFIQNVARTIQDTSFDLEQLKTMKTEDARQALIGLPGIGPYTANLVLSVGLGRSDVIHLDSFVREVLTTFYFRGRRVSDERLIEFARKCWPGFESSAIGLLTTDTHLWADKTGMKFRLKSGARQ